MPEEIISLTRPSNELLKSGNVVGLTDRVYPIKGSSVTFDEVLVKGDLSGELEYNGKKLRIVRTDVIAGLLIDLRGARGPVWQGVECEVFD
jgi:hypothetical protein